jgi:hypothetical protein
MYHICYPVSKLFRPLTSDRPTLCPQNNYPHLRHNLSKCPVCFSVQTFIPINYHGAFKFLLFSDMVCPPFRIWHGNIVVTRFKVCPPGTVFTTGSTKTSTPTRFETGCHLLSSVQDGVCPFTWIIYTPHKLRCSHCISSLSVTGWVEPIAGLDAMEKREITFLCPESKSNPSVTQPIAQTFYCQCIDWAIPALIRNRSKNIIKIM